MVKRKQKIDKKERNKLGKRLKLPQSPLLTKEQEMLQELFGGSPSWGTGENLPKFQGSLISGEGLIKSGDYEGDTASMFGFIKKRRI